MLKKLNDLGQDQATYFIAKVVDNNDPLQMQRVRVTIPSLLEGEIENLPWVLPIATVLSGFTKTSVATNVPPIGAHVVVTFQNDDVNYGLLLGTVPTQGMTLGVLGINYPNRRGWIDTAGNHFFVDTTEGATQLEIRHNSGTSITVSNDGKLVVVVSGDVQINVSGSTNLTTAGNMVLHSEGTMDISSGGNMRIEAPRVDIN